VQRPGRRWRVRFYGLSTWAVPYRAILEMKQEEEEEEGKGV
jgi:hypothetical protein